MADKHLEEWNPLLAAVGVNAARARGVAGPHEQPDDSDLLLRKATRPKLWLRFLFMALFVAGVVRMGPSLADRQTLPAGAEGVRLARSLAFTGDFADPFAPLRTGKSAHMMPGLPILLAGLIHVFGTGWSGYLAYVYCATAAFAAQFALLPALSFRLGIGYAPGIIASLMALIDPPRLYPGWEASYAGLLTVLLTLFWLRCQQNSELRMQDAVKVGVTAGALLLMTATSVLPICVLIAGLIWKFGRSAKAGRLWITALIPVMFLSPWVIRNALVFHTLTVFRTNLGLELQVSNNECATMGFLENEVTGCIVKYHPNSSEQEALKVRQLGEIAYNRVKYQQAVDWIKKNPGAFGSLTLHRVLAYWFPYEKESPLAELERPGRRRQAVIVYATTVMSILGLWLLWRTRRTSFYAMFIWLMTFPPIYYVIQYSDRYRIPILWVTFLAAGYVTWAFARRLLQGKLPGLDNYLARPVKTPGAL